MLPLASLFSPFERFAEAAVTALGLDPATGSGAAVAFFLFEIVKVSILILIISWGMAFVRRALPVEVLRKWLGTPLGRVLGYPAAAGFGALTPFCSCSSVPLFIGFIEARLPVGIALAFLITSPLVNEIVVALFLASFGWEVAAIYVASGVALGVVGGWLLQLLRADRWLTAFARRESVKNAAVSATPQPMQWHDTVPVGIATPALAAVGSSRDPGSASACCVSAPTPATSGGRSGNDSGRAESCDCSCQSPPPPESVVAFANREARDIYLGVLPYLALALLLGAGIHGFVPEQAFATWFATGRWWEVPAAVLLGFPLYASASATVPVLETLVAKGVPLGTGMAFIMSAVGVSVPELILLKRVMNVRLLLAFSATVSIGVVLVGWLFNLIFGSNPFPS